ncbi:hypothetical protein HN903_04710 [archaeon]|nr:hypothetical protein [archaeon]MBT7129030.1 hypothetical protein [archaeon]
MMDKRGSVMNEFVVHVILIALILAVFLFASAERVNGRNVMQQVLEKQLALLIDSAEAGMSFEVWKGNINGVIDDVDIDDGRVFVSVDGLRSVGGYPYFSRYSVEVEEVGDKFLVTVK